ncbi:peptidyl-dipeptidase Dcp [Chlorella sorokiniana]|uniref:Peptidyl-dipeptidase Dcp n=1 Tax=Chlorella sorokiniana TaxID=3076 RepID=A0A2P6TFT4_CHLSO|nr:peptidyl-dipeptidase Dcp [Chlorella sorokiniana]|eukprot:PRW32973.1 peptidyl-dipeptidase Dcp [Chlorella sorokiniana]
MAQPAPAPGLPDAPDCPFTVRVGGELIAPADFPQSERYIVATHSEEHRRQLAALVPSLQYLTESMPLLVGTLTREELQAMCENPVAAAAIRYIERDEKVSIAGGKVSI